MSRLPTVPVAVLTVLAVGALAAVLLGGPPAVTVEKPYVGDESAAVPAANASGDSVLAIGVGASHPESAFHEAATWGPLPEHRPWSVAVVNRADGPQRATVAVAAGSDDETLVSRSVRLGPGRVVALTIGRPGRYAVRAVGERTTTSHVIDPDSFDCNDKRTVMNLGRTNASVETWSTTVGCSSPL